ncbi:MAG: hypothetical protein Q4C70_11430 [Planctomycetia bacterium]|nr:hypothetical protein [Planctomycetia bacterium]
MKRKNENYDSICKMFINILEKNPSPQNETVRLKLLREIMEIGIRKNRKVRVHLRHYRCDR